MGTAPQRLRIDDVDAIASAFERGGCVALPTDTVYGLAARLDDPVAVEALFRLKGRAATKAMAVLVDDVATARRLGRFSDVADGLTRRYWPGPLTVVVRRAEGVAVDLGGDESTIGLRCPDHEVVRSLAARVGPLVTTSANPSGAPTIETADGIADVFGERLAAVVDGGPLAAAASTVVDLSGPGVIVLREGPISTAQVLDLS